MFFYILKEERYSFPMIYDMKKKFDAFFFNRLSILRILRAEKYLLQNGGHFLQFFHVLYNGSHKEGFDLPDCKVSCLYHKKQGSYSQSHSGL